MGVVRGSIGTSVDLNTQCMFTIHMPRGGPPLTNQNSRKLGIHACIRPEVGGNEIYSILYC